MLAPVSFKMTSKLQRIHRYLVELGDRGSELYKSVLRIIQQLGTAVARQIYFHFFQQLILDKGSSEPKVLTQKIEAYASLIACRAP